MHLNRINNNCKRYVQRYDAENRRVLTTYSGTDASGQVLQTNFEAHTPTGLPTRISDPEGRKTNLTYTSAGDLSQITDLLPMSRTI